MAGIYLYTDVAGKNTFAIDSNPITIYRIELDANSADGFTLLDTTFGFSKYFCLFAIQPGSNVFVTYDGSEATVPTNSFLQTTGELNPSCRILDAGTSIGVITPDASNAYITVSVWGYK